MEINVLTLVYLISSITFILGLKMLSHPESARKGNLIAAFGMTIAILATIFLYKDDEGNSLHNYGWIFAGLVVGGVVGVLAAKKVKMTAMPEMVSLFNGMGGACAALISIVEFNHIQHLLSAYDANNAAGFTSGVSVLNTINSRLLIILLGLIIGSVSFAGSIIAWGKLNGKIKDYAFRGQHVTNLVVLAVLLLLAVYVIVWPSTGSLLIFYMVFFLALAYGVLVVLPTGGADMRVGISRPNSCTGVAAACG